MKYGSFLLESEKEMSNWKLPRFSPPQYLPRDTPANADSALQFYSTKLGLNNSLKRITPETSLSARPTEPFSSTNAPTAFTNPLIVSSEVWSSKDFLQSSKKRRWTRCKLKCVACMKSVKCRFTTLGFLLGLLLSLGALIPVLTIWQISSHSGSRTNTTLSPSNTVLTGSSLVISTLVDQCSPYYCEDHVIFITNMTATALSLVITVQQTGNTTYSGAYNTYSTINQTYMVTATQIIYTYFIQSGQLPAGNYTCGAQFHLSGINHTTSADTYSISVTNICGIVNSASGNF